MSEIDAKFELEVAEFYQSLGITCGPGDVQYRLILLIIAKKGKNATTKFYEIRRYTDSIVDRGSIGSKIKSILQPQGLVEKVDFGQYRLTDKGMDAAEFIKHTSNYYQKLMTLKKIEERIPK
jgi:repressor of nif and glnA expression